MHEELGEQKKAKGEKSGGPYTPVKSGRTAKEVVQHDRVDDAAATRASEDEP